MLENLKLGGDQQIGVNIVTRAIEEPMRWIATNAGHEGSIVVRKVREMKDTKGLQRADRQVRESGQGGRHRSGEGRALGAAERGVDRVAAADDRSADLRDSGREEGRADAGGGTAAAWAGCTNRMTWSDGRPCPSFHELSS